MKNTAKDDSLMKNNDRNTTGEQKLLLAIMGVLAATLVLLAIVLTVSVM